MTKFSAFATAIALVAAAAAGPVLAQEATPDYPQANTSTLTRAQVQAELAQAKRDGSMRVWSTSYNHMAAAKSLKTRDEVRAEVLADSAHTAAVLSAEDSGSFAMNQQRNPLRAGTTLAAR